MATAEQSIIEALRRKQDESGMGTRAFARWLDVSPALWTLTRNTGYPLGVRLATAAAQRMPEIEGHVLIFLRYELPTRNRKVRVGTA